LRGRDARTDQELDEEEPARDLYTGIGAAIPGDRVASCRPRAFLYRPHAATKHVVDVHFDGESLRKAIPQMRVLPRRIRVDGLNGRSAWDRDLSYLVRRRRRIRQRKLYEAVFIKGGGPLIGLIVHLFIVDVHPETFSRLKREARVVVAGNGHLDFNAWEIQVYLQLDGGRREHALSKVTEIPGFIIPHSCPGFGGVAGLLRAVARAKHGKFAAG